MKYATILTAVSVFALAGAAQAQTTGTDVGQRAPSDAPESAISDENEIIVTAQRRSQNLQNVPIAITVVDGDALKSNNFTSITDVQYLAPSLKFAPVPASPYFSVRGIGSFAFDYSVEPSVGVSLDDVIQTLPRAFALNTLADVERVEVLRGPQGTLFGKNTSAGLISFITKRPILGERALEGHLQFGSRNELQVYSILNLPVANTLAVRLRAAYQLRDPVNRTVSSGSIPTSRDMEFNGKILWEPSSTLSLYAIGDYQKSHGDPGAWTLRSFGAGTFAPGVGNSFVRTQNTALGVVAGPENRLTAIGTDQFQNTETYSGQLTASLALGSHSLTSVTAYKQLDYAAKLEVDSTPLTVLDNNIGTIEAHQITQELRLASPTGQTFEYVLGGFYYNQELRSTQQQSGGLGFLPNNFPLQVSAVGGLQNFGLSVKSYAAFGEFTVRPAEPIRLILGGRYTYDDISSSVFVSEIPGVCGFELLFVGVCHAAPLPTAPAAGRTKRGDYSGRAGIEFDVADDIMAYATISRGYKGAGFATVSSILSPIKPETVISEELGLKSKFFDRNLTVNLALFHSKFKNFQTQVFDPNVPPTGSYVTGNAGGLKSQGVEIEFAARPLPGLSLSGGVTYADTKFTDYQPPCYAAQTPAQGCSLPGPTFDASGTVLPNSPKWTYNLSAAYETAVGNDLKAFANANYAYRSSVIFGTGNPNTAQEGYGIVNMSVGVGDIDDHVRFSLFARNLFDKRFAGIIFPSYFDTGGYSQVIPDGAYRRIGAALDFRF